MGFFWCVVGSAYSPWKIERCFCISGAPMVLHMKDVVRCESKELAAEILKDFQYLDQEITQG